MKRKSPILEALAEFYEESQAGRTGRGLRDVQRTYEELESRVFERTKQRLEGDSYELAMADLRALDGRVLSIEWDNRRAETSIYKVRLKPENEAEFYAALDRIPPTRERTAWAEVFEKAATCPVPAQYEVTWRSFCEQRRAQIFTGTGLQPFRRRLRTRAAFQLEFAAKLLAWNRRSLLRTVSAQVTGDAKFFERCLGTMETLLFEGSGGTVQSFADLNIEHLPTEVKFHGPLRLRLAGTIKDYDGLSGVSSLTESDVSTAEVIETTAARCVSIENAATFHELCRLDCPDLLILTSYPNQSTIDLLLRLPIDLPLYHWGDTDPYGFDVLRDLRRRAGRVITPLQMRIGDWGKALPSETRARRKLTAHDRQKLAFLFNDRHLHDVGEELRKIDALGHTGDFEQEGLRPNSALFPYVQEKT